MDVVTQVRYNSVLGLLIHSEVYVATC